MDWSSIDLSGVSDVIGHMLSWQVTQFTIAFVLAWKTVRKDMKVEIASQFTKISTSIDAVTQQLIEVKDTVSKDLAATSKRLGNVETGVAELKTGVSKLESAVAQIKGN